MRLGSSMAGIAVVAVALACTGCSNQHGDLLRFLKENEHSVTATEYRVGIPDAIGISAPRVLEIDGAGQTIGPDGKISLRLLGDVSVVDQTPREIGAKLEELLQPYYEDPKVQVVVTAYASKKYYVFGEVGMPGPQIYTGRDSVIDALALAKPTFVAWRSRVEVIRPAPDPEDRVKIMVDLDKMMQTGDMRMNVLLEPGDIVWVPPTPLGWIGHRIREVLHPFMPVVEAYRFPATLMDTQDEYENRSED